MSFAVTLTTIQSYLSNLAQATSSDSTANLLELAAQAIQELALYASSSAQFSSAVNDMLISHGGIASEALKRALSFRREEDGALLSLFLLPVVVHSSLPLPSMLGMGSNKPQGQKLGSLRLASRLTSVMGLSADLSSDAPAKGWVSPLPILMSAAQVRRAPVDAWLTVPTIVRDQIRGSDYGKQPFDFGQPELLRMDSPEVFFLPIVACAFAGNDFSVRDLTAEDSNRLMAKLYDWLLPAMPADLDFDLTIAGAPMPFCQALPFGDRIARGLDIQDIVYRVRDEMGAEPQAVAALVSIYTPRTGAVREPVLGISLVSIMTAAVLATAVLPVDGDERQLLAQAKAALEAAGVSRITVSTAMMDTGACQHCGQLQLGLPSIGVSALAHATLQ